MMLVVETLANNSTKRYKIKYTRLEFFSVNEKQSLKLRIDEKTELPLVNRVFLISLQRPIISDISWLQNYYSDLEMKNLATNLKKVGVILSYFKHEIRNQSEILFMRKKIGIRFLHRDIKLLAFLPIKYPFSFFGIWTLYLCLPYLIFGKN